MLLVVTLLTACSAEVSVERSLHTEAIESQIEAELTEQIGAAVRGVTCPDRVPVETGGSFRCSAAVDQGDELAIEVTQDDDRGNVSWELNS